MYTCSVTANTHQCVFGMFCTCFVSQFNRKISAIWVTSFTMCHAVVLPGIAVIIWSLIIIFLMASLLSVSAFGLLRSTAHVDFLQFNHIRMTLKMTLKYSQRSWEMRRTVAQSTCGDRCIFKSNLQGCFCCRKEVETEIWLYIALYSVC